VGVDFESISQQILENKTVAMLDFIPEGSWGVKIKSVTNQWGKLTGLSLRLNNQRFLETFKN
jgi:hypothetical protein